MSVPHSINSLSTAQVHTDSSLTQALEDARSAAFEQLSAAWQLHVDRVQERLATGWREHIEHVVEERFGELTTRLEEALERTLAERLGREMEAGQAAARRDLAEELNQAARRLRGAKDNDEWAAVLVDACAPFCGKAALFTVEGDVVRLSRAACIDPSAPDLRIPLSEAPAIASAIESKDPVVAMHSPGEVSAEIAGLFPDPADGRVYLFPLVSQAGADAVLCAEAGELAVDLNALELLASLAACLRESTAERIAGPDLVSISGPNRHIAGQAWSALSREEQDLHVKAQRFSRVHVAELRLYKSQAVKEGRAAHNLYAALRSEIDSGREAFRSQHLAACPSMVDYYHLELVRTLANDDDALLGQDYPGPLV